MSNDACRAFVKECLTVERVFGKKVLEVGSGGDEYEFNKIYVKSLGSLSYTGTDVVAFPGVDTVCHICKLEERFGPDSFDVIIATEVLEHVRDWKIAVHQMKTICRPGGVIVLTTRSLGYPYHRASSGDFWRFGKDEMERIFDDFDILALKEDPTPTMPGVFIFAAKPDSSGYWENNLTEIALYSVLARRRKISTSLWEQKLGDFRYKHGRKIANIFGSTVIRRVKRLIRWS